jgi:hypothetical protein
MEKKIVCFIGLHSKTKICEQELYHSYSNHPVKFEDGFGMKRIVSMCENCNKLFYKPVTYSIFDDMSVYNKSFFNWQPKFDTRAQIRQDKLKKLGI